jgi:hypothetical protein
MADEARVTPLASDNFRLAERYFVDTASGRLAEQKAVTLKEQR